MIDVPHEQLSKLMADAKIEGIYCSKKPLCEPCWQEAIEAAYKMGFVDGRTNTEENYRAIKFINHR